MPLQKVKYKKPRKINPISVTLAAVALVIGFLIYQYVPLAMKSGEATRVLDEFASKYAGQPGRYREYPQEVQNLTRKMRNNMQLIGVTDPDMEVWIEADSKFQVRFGVLYSEWVRWPFDVIEAQEKVYELEYTLTLKK